MLYKGRIHLRGECGPFLCSYVGMNVKLALGPLGFLGS